MWSDLETDARRHSLAAERNAAYILAALQRLLPKSGLLLEVASGTGQHAALCSVGLPGWTWLPSDADAAALQSIRSWCAGRPNVMQPLQLDVLQPQWPGAYFSPSWTAFQADRGRDFSVIVDGVSN
jgi:hypothetical protein